MVVATLLLICSIPQMDDTAKVVNESPAVVSDRTTKDSSLVASASLPSAPEPKAKADAEPIAPNPAAQPFVAVKPVIIRPRETRKKLITALKNLDNKRDKNPPKKHGNIPL